VDHVYLTGPQGTVIDVGSWIRTDPGPDYGAHDLVQQQYAESALAEGGRFAYETEPVRRMTFPLMVPSGGLAGQSLETIENLLRQCARPNGYIDIQPDGTPSTAIVRFDILGGRVNHDPYSIPIQRAGRRQLSLALDVQPFGYWPTWITLASVASVALPGVLSFNAPASLIGDIPALVELVALATGASSGGANPTYMFDAFAYGNAGRPSFSAQLAGGSWVTAGTVIGDRYALGSQAAGVPYPAAAAGWALKLSYPIPSALEPAYRGRYRAFALFSGHASVPYQVSLDAGLDTLAALASAAPIATVAPTSGAYDVWLDLGELTLPAVGSGIQQQQLLRLWANPVSIGASSMFTFGGAYLLPLDGESGIMPRGLSQPSVGIAHASQTITGFRAAPDVGPAPWVSSQPAANGYIYYRGQLPRAGASIVQFDLIGMQRLGSVASGVYPDMIRADGSLRAQASVRYRPRFSFLRGL
jgi:hypothetical protein